ncbi:hypothetical protein [Naasia lichenicola]|uniref:hypothetical protein n=1 Tax=Naasia lichenicola TaxID=2565933 RepID=UPI00130DDC32|nr:hypothetical protein [Naasia lichenicola]
MVGETDHSEASSKKEQKQKRTRRQLPPDPFGEPPHEEADRSFEPYKFVPPGITGGLGS